MTPAPSAMARARAAWNGAPPDWVEALAAACDETSQAVVAARLGRSKALVSLTINGRYTGDLTAVEQLVRGALMAATVDCPVVGSLPTDQCLEHQRAPWSPHNPQRIAFYRACRQCPQRKGGKDAE